MTVASTSDNTGGIAVFDEGQAKTSRLEKLWCDSGFKNTFLRDCQRYGLESALKRQYGVTSPRQWEELWRQNVLGAK